MGALEEVRDLAEAVARRRSLYLWDVEMGGRPGRAVVRVYVDSDDGVDLETVAQVSEEISRGLDLRDPIQGNYTLEVSSPGLERSLKTPEHFTRSIGRKVVVKTTTPLIPSGNRIEGVLVSAEEGAVRIEMDDAELDVPFGSIRQARTVFEWK